MSSPLTAGAALLMREYLAKYEGMDRPSSALLRAAFIGGAKPVKTYEDGKYYAVPSVECGWGGVDVGGTLAPTNAMTLFVDHVETNLVDGAEWTTTLNVTNSAVPLRVALAWTDYPASEPDVPALVNDYDLVVTDPFGKRVWCNGREGEDCANPQETVFVETPARGPWTVTVRAHRVVVDGSVLGLYCRVSFEVSREGEALDLSDANADYVKAIVRCAEDLGFEAEIEAEKPSATQTGAAWTVELRFPSGKAAAFVRIEIK